METTEDLNTYKEAYNSSFKFNEENLEMLSWYVNRLISAVYRQSNLKVLSLGIGHRIVSQTIINSLKNNLLKYIIIEGAQDIIRDYLTMYNLPKGVEIVQSLFESFETDERFDVIEMGFVLEHVDDPYFILAHFKKFLKKDGSMFMAVPNARSLHRAVGHKAGCLDNMYKLSGHDLHLGHKRYFDYESLTKLVLALKLNVVRTEGIFLKPFATRQLQQLNLSKHIYKALYIVGQSYPEISNAILLEARL